MHITWPTPTNSPAGNPLGISAPIETPIPPPSRLLVAHASFSGENVSMVVSLRHISPRIRVLHVSLLCIRSLELATCRSCCCIFRSAVETTLLSLFLMRLRPDCPTLSMAVSLLFLPYNNRFSFCSYLSIYCFSFLKQILLVRGIDMFFQKKGILGYKVYSRRKI